MFSVSLSHTPWIPERIPHAKALQADIKRPVVLCTEKAPNHVWSAHMWEDAAETKQPYHLFIQDDVLIAPDFEQCLEAMLTGMPPKLLGLETAHPAARTLMRRGEAWCSTTDGLIGVAYVIEHNTLVDFLEWRQHALAPKAVEKITEDTLINLYGVSKGIHILHPVPTIIDHDVEVKSTYGNDHHKYRRPSVTWQDMQWIGMQEEWLKDPDYWRLQPGEEVTHLGRFYKSPHHELRRYVKGFTQADFDRIEADRVPKPFDRYFW